MKGKDDGADRIGRRTYLGVAASAGLAGLAGCTSGTTASAGRAPPKVPKAMLESGGWEHIGGQTLDPAFEQSVGPVSVSAAFETLVYEDTALAAEIKEQTLGQAEGQFFLFFATRVTLEPSLSNIPKAARGTVVDQIETQARTQYEAQLKDVGVTNVEQSGTGSMTVDTGDSARVTEYAATIPFESITFPFTEEKKFEIEGREVDVSGLLAVWEHDGTVLVAGGAYPGENFELDVTKEPTDAISVSVDIDLGLTPDAYREELRSIIKAVE
ncbi:hypothetical protein E6P09_01725 [Haloferax mediterranei ATCC 33500]|uniref:Lipoprotein n=1 Tax=Haloferax mediterranei (strain ATCC 33500 / DSM 1411 / JCM 8866 / NBRC 14739 / NCIMB 2177 / R-4) TaxID=523841 RepID=I3R626_HALMT|nr:DUF6517 family protein [Haloferax mediterranei]AFK19686.1 hypothetical protein HFX_1993 [Haloferax mediterranei ATCC 33500]AHZ23075.1 hypothetical protein BM92_10705 [Haloferax mediterranei ATCC 33500]EMA00008.1 hypothetical protein C439_11748 [Haloferax mediterranei ATCC 33500]MDX5987571.1 DUF6517 family protein [Haloferax mediterranei ATCC 33500]QCQ74063.1 hypothetical protein E6P09_01725 [Haloferax mediterranei ATCC 33500]